jgi:putative NIF3 family GTP cyclohydrolase 1 type 2
MVVNIIFLDLKYVSNDKIDVLLLLVNDWLASGLGKGACKPITPTANPPIGQEESGSGRLFTFEEPTQLTTIVDRVKKLIGLPYCKLVNIQKEGHFFMRNIRFLTRLFTSAFGYC